MKDSTRVLITLLSFITLFACASAQDMPHEEMDFDCEVCHSMTEFKGVQFDHTANTGFTLEHRHANVECKSCHNVKDFSIIDTECMSCHRDIHEGKLGPLCEKCHTTRGFEIFNIEDIHAETNFPMMGRHAQVDCQSCHKGLPRGDLSFNTTRCVECHQQNYIEVASPNHVAGGFPTDCSECHQMNSWQPAMFANHDAFFPIFSGEHAGEWDECSDCHIDPDNFLVISCLNCHEHNRQDTDDNHEGVPGYNYDTQDCLICHPGGRAGQFVEHDALYFPIFSGSHAGEWDGCSNCHDNPADRTMFNCLACHFHNETDMNNMHQSISGYSYVSTACFSCHPAGEGIEFTQHDAAYFPIYTGTHSGVWTECSSCHTEPTDRSVFSCLGCHGQTETNTIHQGISTYAWESTACLTCHPTGAGGDFLEHDVLFFPIYSGTHSGVWDACSICHTDPNDRSVFSCLTCHSEAETNPIHGGITDYTYESTACLTCHPTGSGGEFLTHDAEYFPIYSGTHAGTWNDCITCHFNPDDRSQFTCLVCHEQSTVDPVHTGMTSYSYESTVCLSCHPQGVVGDYLEHDADFFPIYSGPHAGSWAECATCHTDPADRSVFSCLVCHNQTDTDDMHTGITGYVYNSTDCITCHPTGEEIEFTEHELSYFPIYSGAHASVWTECATCHPVPGDRTVYDCLSCHEQTTIDGLHLGMLSYSYASTACYGCHASGSVEDYLEHDAAFFPVYSGTHSGQWTECASCHTDPTDKSVYTCLGCHEQTTIDGIHLGMPGYSYQSSVCLTCHPSGVIEDYVEHDGAFFPIYSGTHSGQWVDCSNCHTDPTDKSVFTCLTCHEQSTIDGIHLGMLSYSYESSACFSCHPTGVVQDYLEHDGAFFPIYSGTHAGQWVDCSNCHTDPADKSVVDCLGCHVQAPIDVIHQGMLSYSYVTSACLTCHPSGVVEDYLEHDGAFFPIYTGPHAGAWVDCATCHTDPADRSVFSCTVCHTQTDMDNMHTGITGYVYNSSDCLTCHPVGQAIEFTEHELLYFPIYSGAHDGVWDECATCHTVVGDRTQFSCLSCHEQATADIVHMGMPEYSYASDVCYSCHPRGVPEDYLQHDVNGFFPIYSGNHDGVWAQCATCHIDPNNRSVFTCLVCHTQGVIDPVHLGMPEYSYESNVCYSCHPGGVIEDYLSHDTYFFPIYSGTHDGRWSTCATCHIDPMDKSVFSCLVGCHPKTSTDAKHSNPTPVSGYVYDSYECYNCHPTGLAP
ncbi:MAG: hypothetical protein AB1483_04590 [Candidatus Zixiibacteriota bacterium]